MKLRTAIKVEKGLLRGRKYRHTTAERAIMIGGRLRLRGLVYALPPPDKPAWQLPRIHWGFQLTVPRRMFIGTPTA